MISTSDFNMWLVFFFYPQRGERVVLADDWVINCWVAGSNLFEAAVVVELLSSQSNTHLSLVSCRFGGSLKLLFARCGSHNLVKTCFSSFFLLVVNLEL